MSKTSAAQIPANAKYPCARACLATHLTTALAHCEKCVQGTKEDRIAFVCMGKVSYLRNDFDASCNYYVRAAAVCLPQHATGEELAKLRRLAGSKRNRAQELAVAIISEHEPTLIYHLGHARHCLVTDNPDEHRNHLLRYTKGLRGLTPEAYEPALDLLAYFHDQGLIAMRERCDLLLAVFEQYQRLSEKQAQEHCT